MFAEFSAALCEIFLFKPCCVPPVYALTRRRMYILPEVKFVRSKKALKSEKSNKMRFFNYKFYLGLQQTCAVLKCFFAVRAFFTSPSYS